MNLLVRIDVDKATRGILDDVTGTMKAGMTNVVAGIEALAVKKAPTKKGNLARTRMTNVSEDGMRGEIAFTAPYAGWVHEGTGLFGPHNMPIVPTSKKALFWPGAEHPVRAVKGMKGRPFVMDAAHEADPDKLYEEGARNYLAQRGGK